MKKLFLFLLLGLSVSGLSAHGDEKGAKPKLAHYWRPVPLLCSKISLALVDKLQRDWEESHDFLPVPKFTLEQLKHDVEEIQQWMCVIDIFTDKAPALSVPVSEEEQRSAITSNIQLVKLLAMPCFQSGKEYVTIINDQQLRDEKKLIEAARLILQLSKSIHHWSLRIKTLNIEDENLEILLKESKALSTCAQDTLALLNVGVTEAV